MAKKEKGFLTLRPIPGGPFDQFARERAGQAEKLPKDSNTYLYNLVDIYGSEEIANMSEVGIGDYVYNKGIVHAMNMNVGRNIPWIEDGLKSVERRVLFIMFKDGLWGKKKSKVATIVGDMISYVYPHGDAAPAETIYRLGRSRSMMIPYIQELSNFGNMQDLKPAASRYADASLSAYAYDCFFSEIGPRRPLYDERDNYAYSGKEPIFLTSRFPNILMQWNLGIGKGAMSWLGAFNSSDLFKATLTLMDDPTAKIDIYPDTPVPLEIINKSELRGCFDREQFKVKMRAPYHVEVDQRPNGSKVEDKHTIVFTALPLGVNGNQIRDEVTALKKAEEKKANKKFGEVVNIEVIADDEAPGGIKVIVEYVRGYDPHVLAEKLFKATSLGKTVGVKYNLIFNNQPEVHTPREILLLWITQRYDQKRRYYHQLVLKAAKDRAMYDALSTILATPESRRKAIDIIEGSKDDEESVKKLRATFDFTDFQARVIIDMKLKNLQRMNVKDTIERRDQAIKDYKHYRKLLGDDQAIKDAVRDELKEGLKKYGKPRMAKLKNLKGATIGEPDEMKYILYNRDYYFCASSTDGIREIWPKIDNSYRMVQVKNSDNVLVFDQNGILKILNGYAFSLTDTGISMATLGASNVVSIMTDSPGKGYDSVVMITEQGYGKMMDLVEVTKSVKSRIINLNTDDKLADVIPVKGNCHPDSVIGMIQGDKMFYLKVEDFPKYKRSSAGNRMIKNVKDLKLSHAIYFDATDSPDYMLIYAESGYMKILDTQFLSFSKRGNNTISLQGKGIVGATLIHGTEDDVDLYMGSLDNGKQKVRIQIGKMVRFNMLATGEEQKFKMSTSIGTPVKVLRMKKNEWYAIT